MFNYATWNGKGPQLLLFGPASLVCFAEMVLESVFFLVFFVTCLSQIALRTEIWKGFNFGHVVPCSRCVFENLANISTDIEPFFCAGIFVKSQKSETGERFMHRAGVCRWWQMDPAVLLPSSFLNFLYSVFVVAVCLFGSSGSWRT